MPRPGKASKYVPPFEALEKMRRYCSVQERSYKSVREKLYNWGLRSEEVENIMAELITDKFLSEQRFADAYASGKFRIKGWGKRKIVQGLKQLEVSEVCITSAIQQIDDQEYDERLIAWVIKRAKFERAHADFEAKGRVARFLINKGFEPDLVWDKINENFGQS